MKVAAVQHDVVWEDPDANFARLAPMIGAAAAAGARLVVLTEMFATGFSMSAYRVAQPFDGASAQFLAAQARERDVWVGGSVPERRLGGGRPRNVFVLAAPDGALHRYAKIHPFSYSGEHEVYDAGTEPVCVDVEGVRTALFVCYDLRFGAEFWGLAPEVDCYLVVANWPAARREHWRTLLRARAVENQAYVVGVNRVGDGDGVAYGGDSAIVGPFGEVLAEASGVEALLVAEVSPERVAEVRTRYPFLADRQWMRPDES